MEHQGFPPQSLGLLDRLGGKETRETPARPAQRALLALREPLERLVRPGATGSRVLWERTARPASRDRRVTRVMKGREESKVQQDRKALPAIPMI
jgi:hypothetical protein